MLTNPKSAVTFTLIISKDAGISCEGHKVKISLCALHVGFKFVELLTSKFAAFTNLSLADVTAP